MSKTQRNCPQCGRWNGAGHRCPSAKAAVPNAVASLPRPASAGAVSEPTSRAVSDVYKQFQRVSAGASTTERPGPPLALEGFTIDTSYPFPQDMPLGKVATVVDLIHSGDVTDQDLSWSLDVSTQQGNYAANAAGYLGFVHRDKDTLPHSLSLTESGEAFLNASPAERVQILSVLIDQMAADDPATRGYSDTTTEYRQGTAARWKDRATSPDAEINIQQTQETAVARARTTTRPVRTRPRRPEPQYSICPRCFMAVPATGVCDTCD